MPTINLLQLNFKIDLLKNRFRYTVALAKDRAAGHLDNPQKYPLPADGKALETAFYCLYASLSNLRQRKIINEALPRLQSTGASRQQYYGELATLNLGITKAIAEQAAALSVADNMRFTQVEIDTLKSKNPERAAKKPAVPKATPHISVNPNVVFFVDSLTCEKTSEIRKDEVSLAGFGVDNLLNITQNLSAFSVGDFKKGESTTLNRQLFSFELDNNSSVALSFSARLFLIEKDWIRDGGKAEKVGNICNALGLAMVIIAAGMMIVGALSGPFSLAVVVATFVIGVALQITGGVITLAGDDTSSVGSDTIVLEPPFVVGTRQDAVINFELTNHTNDLTVGKYKASGHWEVVA